ncbi:MAG: 30S ribosomal protein S5 [Candidatus Nanohaloarchaeota archaeon QJJ-7]|nr:30S ribosomal protein S5 [Candidatus Nanohaloarchaeota archaeon QJJ-7]
MAEESEEIWKPKTSLGRDVLRGEISDIDQVLHSKDKIKEPEIVDQLLPNLDEEVILIGGTPGKGGGQRRIVSRRTVRMHKSGRRFNTKAMVVVGNNNGLLGASEGNSDDTRDAIDKARDNAKLEMIEVRRGCGSWECGCGEPHSIPFRVEGKSGSVEVELKPAPRGIGRAASEEISKVLDLAGIDDIWVESRGNTKSRENHVKAVFNALKQLNKMKTSEEIEEKVGVVEGEI